MVNLIPISLGFAVLSVLVVASLQFDPKIESYKFIDMYLESKSGSVEQWLESMENKADSVMTTAAIKRSLTGEERAVLIDTIKQFLAMKNILEPGIKCTKKSYEIIKSNIDAVMAAEPLGVDEAYDTIDVYADQHASQCYEKYPNRVEAIMNRIDKNTKITLTKISRSITSQIQYKIKQPKFPGVFFEPASAIQSVNQVSGAMVMSVRKLSADRGIILSKWTPKKSILEAIETNYITPCLKFINATEDVFLPASVDFMQLSRREQILQSKDDFFDAWGTFKICTFINSNREELIRRVSADLK